MFALACCSVPGLSFSATPESALRAPEFCSHSQSCWLASSQCYPASPSDSLPISPWFPPRTQTTRPHTVVSSAGSHASASGTPSRKIAPAERGKSKRSMKCVTENRQYSFIPKLQQQNCIFYLLKFLHGWSNFFIQNLRVNKETHLDFLHLHLYNGIHLKSSLDI